MPSTDTDPTDGLSNAATRCSSVDLPAPFGPRRPVMPGPMATETSFTATTLPYQRETWSTRIVAPAGGVASGTARCSDVGAATGRGPSTPPGSGVAGVVGVGAAPLASASTLAPGVPSDVAGAE